MIQNAEKRSVKQLQVTTHAFAGPTSWYIPYHFPTIVVRLALSLDKFVAWVNQFPFVVLGW